jgi:hypothetical protein
MYQPSKAVCCTAAMAGPEIATAARHAVGTASVRIDFVM